MTVTEFRRQLAETQAAVDAYLRRVPNWHLGTQVVPQLAALELWTRNGRHPSKRERDRINLGLLTVREIEPTDDLELYRIGQGFHELQYGLSKMPFDRVPPWLRKLVGHRL
jgi:hypothetical protein